MNIYIYNLFKKRDFFFKKQKYDELTKINFKNTPIFLLSYQLSS